MAKRAGGEQKPFAELLQKAQEAGAEKKKGQPLVDDCQGCVFYRAEKSLCHRHAPSPGEGGQLQLVYWPEVSPNARCGSGAPVWQPGDAEVVACGACVHWFQPGGAGFKPKWTEGHSAEWWSQTGYCTAHAPYPTTDKRIVTWKVTHASEGCGDGAHVGDVGDEMADAATAGV